MKSSSKFLLSSVGHLTQDAQKDLHKMALNHCECQTGKNKETATKPIPARQEGWHENCRMENMKTHTSLGLAQGKGH